MKIGATAIEYGRSALELLENQIAELRGGDTLSPMTVVVASNSLCVATRRQLAARPSGIANVHFTTVESLAESLGAARLAEGGFQPASAALIAAAIRAALYEEPGVFQPVADHPATERALASAYRELRRIPDAAADAVAECSIRASDVIRIFRDARDRLSVRWYDEEDLLLAATDELQRGACPEIGPVILHLLPNWTPRESDFIQALASRGPLRVNVGLTNSPDADSPVFAAYERAGIEITIAESLDPPCASGIISASDPDEEVRAAVRLVMQWAQEGVRLGRIALLFGNADPYARLADAHLGAAGIAITGTPIRSLGDMLFGRTLRGLLTLPDRAFRRPDVLAILADATILDGDHPTPTRTWERLSREAGVVGGEDWSQRLPLLAAKVRKRADEADQTGDTSVANYRRRQADRAEALANFVERLRGDLARGSKQQTWAGFVHWSTELLQTYLGGESSRTNWPEEEQDAAVRVEKLLGQLAELDAVGGPSPGMTAFRQTVESALAASATRAGRLGSGVLIGHVSVAQGLTFDRIVVLGMAEERFPPRRLEDSLLPDVERATADGHLELRADRVHDDHRHLLAAVAGAEQAVLTWPRGDLRQSSDQPASRWLLDDAARLSGVAGIRSADLLKLRDQPWLSIIASFADGVARATVFTTDQDLRLAAIARRALNSPILTDDASLTSALTVVDSRSSHDFTRFDGNLSDFESEIVGLQRVSATQLQTWATCPRGYLFKYILGVDHVEEPERRLRIDALDRGTLFHAILEQFIREALRNNHPLITWSQRDRERLHEIAENQFARFHREGRTGRELLWRRDRSQILAELDRTLDRDNTRLTDGIRPVAAEHHFDLVEVPIPAGNTLYVNGSIDRIDQCPDGSLEIIDYKSGSHTGYKNLTEETPHDGGKRLQLYLYALAGRQQYPDAPSVHASYWFTKTDQLIGYPVTEQVEQRVSAAIHTIAAGIEAGIFPAHPSKTDPRGWVECWACTPDGLSSSQLRGDWGRKRHDPVLLAYADLAEPEDAQ